MASPCLGGLWFGYCLRIEPLNKRRLGEAVLRAGGFANEEAAARAVNAEPWDPMPGMVRRECPECRYCSPEPAVTKAELITGLTASNPHLRRPDVELTVATIFDQNTGALARGGRIELRGFGAFTVKQRNARTDRNPLTGELCRRRRRCSSRSAGNCASGSIASRAGPRQRTLRNRGGFGIRTDRSGTGS
jgi:nucleoid DNA-binding protein